MSPLNRQAVKVGTVRHVKKLYELEWFTFIKCFFNGLLRFYVSCYQSYHCHSNNNIIRINSTFKDTEKNKPRGNATSLQTLFQTLAMGVYDPP